VPNNKKQHFVPQFYLRNFASDLDRKQLHLVNISRRISVFGAQLRGQSYRDYFYDREGRIESFLTMLESDAAAIVRRLVGGHGYHESLDTLTAISRFLVVQLRRTTSAVQQADDMVDGFVKILFQHQFTEEQLAGVRIRLTQGAALNTVLAFLTAPLLLDMRVAILSTDGALRLFASDNPAIFVNPFLATKRGELGTGLAHAGLLVFLPISPGVAVILYDQNIYSIEKDGLNRVRRHRRADIEMLNELQYLSAFENIYFSDRDDAELILEGLARTQKRREKPKVAVREFVETDVPGKFVRAGESEAATPKRKSIVLSSHRGLDADVRLSFIKFRPKPRYQDDGSAAGPVRDRAWIRLVDDFNEALKSDQVRLSQLAGFATRHFLWPDVLPWKARLL
jgi:hypothetical protein